MIERSRIASLGLIALLLLGASGCGQMGPLYLPDDAANAGQDRVTEGDGVTQGNGDDEENE